MFTRIMVAVDIERKAGMARTIAAAAHIAQKEAESQLHFVSVRSDDSGLTALEFSEAVEAFVTEQVERLGVDAEWTAIADDDVDEGLARAVEDLKPLLVVMGAHEPRWTEMFTGPTLRDFVAECETSVLIVR